MHPDRPHYDVVIVGARAAGAATAMLLARAGLRVLAVDRSRYGADPVGEASRERALAEYQATRDRLSMPLFDTIDPIAAQQWSDDEIGALLRAVSAAMADEVDHLAGLDGIAVP